LTNWNSWGNYQISGDKLVMETRERQSVGEELGEQIMEWAKGPRKHIEWVRDAGRGKGVEVEKYVLGHVLFRIIGDDAACIAGFTEMSFNPTYGWFNRMALMERMDWEIETSETPEEVRRRLEETKKELESLDWGHWQGFSDASDSWYELRDWVSGLVGERPEFREAIDYQLNKRKELFS